MPTLTFRTCACLFYTKRRSLARPLAKPLHGLAATRSKSPQSRSTQEAVPRKEVLTPKHPATDTAPQARPNQQASGQTKRQHAAKQHAAKQHAAKQHATRQQRPPRGSKQKLGPKGKAQTPEDKSPMKMTRYIKDQWHTATQSVKAAPPGRVMSVYIGRMDQLCSQSRMHLNCIHINTILYGTAQIYAADKAHHGGSLQLQLYGPGFTEFLSKMLSLMLQKLPTVTCRQSSSTLWSFAQFGLSPDDLIPGSVDSLAQQFVQDIASATGQSYSSLFLACADLQLNPCRGQLLQSVTHHLRSTDRSSLDAQAVANMIHSLVRMPSLDPSTELLDVLSGSFLHKLQSADASQRPNSEGIASVMWAFASMPSAKPSLQLLKALGDSFMEGMQSPDASQHPTAHSLANFMWALAKLPSAEPPVQLLDALSNSFIRKVQSQNEHERPNEQAVANFCWALKELKHVPQASASAALLDRMLHLCQSNGQHPSPQTISNFLLAYAELRLAIRQEEADALIDHLLAQETDSAQQMANTAWSLAVSGVLQLSTFRKLLSRLHAIPASLQPPKAGEMRQLFQALEWLRPASDAKPQDHRAWSELQVQLQRLGTRPQPRRNTFGSTEMHAALTKLGLQCSLGDGVRGYTVTAIVPAQNSTAQPILCDCSPLDCFSNEPSRLTGRAVFRRKLLAREGVLVNVPVGVMRPGADHLAEYLKPKLEGIAAGILDAYRL